jgi:hypothetical protein
MDPSYYVRGVRILGKKYIDSWINNSLYEDSTSPYVNIDMSVLDTAEKRQVIMESINSHSPCGMLRRSGKNAVKMHINYTYAFMEHAIRDFEQYLVQTIIDACMNKPLNKKYLGVFLPEINNMLVLLDKSVTETVDAATTLVSLKRKFRY